jgi:hypothetical protein
VNISAPDAPPEVPDGQGNLVRPAARLRDGADRPLAEALRVTPQDGSGPLLPDGTDASAMRFVAPDGALLAERRDGVLHLDPTLPAPVRTAVIGAWLTFAVELTMPLVSGASAKDFDNDIVEPFAGFASLHDAYAERQAKEVAEYARPRRIGGRMVYRPGVLIYRQEFYYRYVLPVMLVAALIYFAVTHLT